MRENPETVCDGCGAAVPAGHLRDRIRRIEMGSRFRPPRIRVLFLAKAAEFRREDFFYGTGQEPRSEAADHFFDELMSGLGLGGLDTTRETRLLEFQKRGFFLAHAFECPLPAGQLDGTQLIERHGPAIVARVKNSFKPGRIVLLSKVLERHLLPLLVGAGLGETVLVAPPPPLKSAGGALERWRASLAQLQGEIKTSN